jgi:ubiquinone/menaquinone biosynthesis C-methylase UbiE
MGNTDIFERMAAGYDTAERIHIARVSSEAIRERLVDTGSKSAIDFGCGTGLVGMSLLNAFKSVLFLDASPNMINQIKQKIVGYNLQNAEPLCFDFEKEDRSNLQADYIFMAQVLLHIQDVEFILSRLYDVLKPGGHLLIVDFDKNEEIVTDMVHNGFDQGQLRDLMSRIGYTNVQSKTFYSGRNIFMNHDASMFILDALK